MRFRFGRKSEKQDDTPSSEPAPQTGLHRVLAAAESLTAASDNDIQNNFDSVRRTWGAPEILRLSAADLRRQVTEILTNDAAEGFTEVMADKDQDSAQPRVQFNTISTRSGTGRFYRIMRCQDGRYALYGHQAMYRSRQRADGDRESSSVSFLDLDLSPIRFLVIATPAEATQLLQTLLKKGAPPNLFEMDFGVGDLKCIGLPGGSKSSKPTITISESHEPVAATGAGVRECVECEIRWKSVYGELMDARELNKLTAQGDVSVNASREQTIGLTCVGCRRSRCLKHLGQQMPTGSLAESNVKCRSCGKSMYFA